MSLNLLQRQIVDLFRKMSDEEIWQIVQGHIGTVGVPAPAAKAAAPAAAPKPRKRRAAKAKAAAPAKVKAAAKPKKTRTRRTSAEREKLLLAVESVVKDSSGLSASQVAAKVKAPQPRVAAALRELKTAKRIHQGGERRFARYAGDAKTAKNASLAARSKK